MSFSRLIGWLNKNKYYEKFLQWYLRYHEIDRIYSGKRMRSTCSSCQWHWKIILSEKHIFDLFQWWSSSSSSCFVVDRLNLVLCVCLCLFRTFSCLSQVLNNSFNVSERGKWMNQLFSKFQSSKKSKQTSFAVIFIVIWAKKVLPVGVFFSPLALSLFVLTMIMGLE